MKGCIPDELLVDLLGAAKDGNIEESSQEQSDGNIEAKGKMTDYSTMSE